MPGRKHLAAVLLLAVAGGQLSARTPAPAPAPVQGGAAFRAAMVAGHDAARAAVGEAPLAWDPVLAASAQAHADAMAATGLYRHAVQPATVARQGENMWRGMRGAYRFEEMVALWVGERDDFVNAPTPGFSRSGDWHRVGHYTQIVWRGTTRFGCAMASDATSDYVVCRYAPAGNVLGQRAF